MDLLESSLEMTLSDPEGHMNCSKPFSTLYLRNKSLFPMICLRANQKPYVTDRIEIEGLLKVTDSHIYIVKVVTSRKRCKIATFYYRSLMESDICLPNGAIFDDF